MSVNYPVEFVTCPGCNGHRMYMDDGECWECDMCFGHGDIPKRFLPKEYAEMKITTITYKAVKNLGNYQSEHLEMSADVEEGEDPEQAALQLRWRVNSLLNSPPSSTMDKPQEDPPLDF